MPNDIKIDTSNTTMISTLEMAGVHYLRVRLWPAPDGCHYIPCADIAALYETMKRSPDRINGIGVHLVHEPTP